MSSENSEALPTQSTDPVQSVEPGTPLEPVVEQLPDGLPASRLRRWLAYLPPLSTGLAYAALLLLTGYVYAATRFFQFQMFDDDLYVVDNPHVLGGLTFSNLWWAVSSTEAANWHPLTWLSLMFDAQLHGPNAGWFHLSNVLIHALNACVLYAALSRLTEQSIPSWIVAALFAVHPLHVESVAWIAERKDVLSTFWVCCGLWTYAVYSEREEWPWLAACGGCLAVSLLAKQMYVTFPCLLLVLDYWPLKRLSRDALREKRPLYVLTVLFSLVAWLAQRSGGAIIDLQQLPFGSRCLNVLVAYVLYVRKLFYPVDLAPFYPFPGAISLWTAAGAGALLLGVTVLAWLLRKKRPYLLVGWLWYLGTLVPVIGLVQIGHQRMADRYMYFPAVGLFIMAAWPLAEWFGQSAWKRVLATGAVAGAIAVLAWMAQRQTALWLDSITLMRHTLQVAGESDFTRVNLGKALALDGDVQGAIRNFTAAIRLNPQNGTANMNLGLVLLRAGDDSAAIPPLERATVLMPRHPEARFGLGRAYLRQKRLADARRELEASVRVRPDPRVHNELGMALMELNDRPAGIAQFEAALRLNPESTAAQRNLERARQLP